MTKILTGGLITCVTIIVLLFWLYSNTSAKLERETLKNLDLEMKLRTQNEAIEKIKIDTEEYHLQREKKIKDIESKYNKLLNTKQEKVYIKVGCQELESTVKMLYDILQTRYN